MMIFFAPSIWKYRVITLAATGLLLIGAGLLMLTRPEPVYSQNAAVAIVESVDAATAYSQAIPDAEYVGSRECRSCHRSMASDHADTRHA
ncbi:MAG: hypothetical protein IT319_15260, partial [Anaerolineae bacterium]|nr:hypothetical protein [Anaerolineae bacterium]